MRTRCSCSAWSRAPANSSARRPSSSVERSHSRRTAPNITHSMHAAWLVYEREPEARIAAERALALEPRDALTLDTIGVVLSRLGAHERAVDVFHRAVLAAPRNPSFQFNLAAALRFLGRFAQAEQAYENVIALDPTFFRAHSALSELRRQTPESNHVQRLLAALATLQSDADGELHLRHALAKEYEDLGDFDAAFEHLAAGKAKKRAQLRYSIDADRALFASVETLFDRSRIAAGAVGHPSAEPIFVVGMPRTGTTLVERILSSHSHGALRRRAAELRSLPETLGRDVVEARLGRGDLEARRRRRFRRARCRLRCEHSTVDRQQAAVRRQDAAEFLLHRVHSPRAAAGEDRLPAARSAGYLSQQLPPDVCRGVLLLQLRVRSRRHRALLCDVRSIDEPLGRRLAGQGPRSSPTRTWFAIRKGRRAGCSIFADWAGSRAASIFRTTPHRSRLRARSKCANACMPLRSGDGGGMPTSSAR